MHAVYVLPSDAHWRDEGEPREDHHATGRAKADIPGPPGVPVHGRGKICYRVRFYDIFLPAPGFFFFYDMFYLYLVFFRDMFYYY